MHATIKNNIQTHGGIAVNIRKQEIGLVSVCLCILVVFIHVSSWTIQDMDKQSVQFILLLTPWRLSAFVVQGFIFLSGLKLFLSQKPFSYGAFLRSRAKKILLPYLIWVGLYYAFFIAIGWYRFSLLDLAEYIFLGTLCAHFYFIVIIVQFYLLMPLFRALLSRFDARLLCAVTLLLTILFKLFVHFQYDDRVFCGYLFYFMLGAASREKLRSILRMARTALWICVRRICTARRRRRFSRMALYGVRGNLLVDRSAPLGLCDFGHPVCLRTVPVHHKSRRPSAALGRAV